jgi:hypothetical protein
MGFLSRLFGLGALAGTAYAAAKITQKYDENKANETKSAESEGREVKEKDTSGVIGDVAKAAGEVFGEANKKVKATVSTVTEKLKSSDSSEIVDDIKDGTEKAVNEAKEKVEDIKDSDVVASVKEGFEDVKDNIKDAVESIKDNDK